MCHAQARRRLRQLARQALSPNLPPPQAPSTTCLDAIRQLTQLLDLSFHPRQLALLRLAGIRSQVRLMGRVCLRSRSTLGTAPSHTKTPSPALPGTLLLLFGRGRCSGCPGHRCIALASRPSPFTMTHPSIPAPGQPPKQRGTWHLQCFARALLPEACKRLPAGLPRSASPADLFQSALDGAQLGLDARPLVEVPVKVASHGSTCGACWRGAPGLTSPSPPGRRSAIPRPRLTSGGDDGVAERDALVRPLCHQGLNRL